MHIKIESKAQLNIFYVLVENRGNSVLYSNIQAAILGSVPLISSEVFELDCIYFRQKT